MISGHIRQPKGFLLGIFAIALALFASSGDAHAGKLSWPLGCIPGVDCLRDNVFHLSFPDIDGDGKAFDCGPPGYRGHTGTDVTVTSVEDGIPVLAADDGVVLWVSGGKFDHCPNDSEPDCRPELRPVVTGVTSGSNYCTDFGPACGAEDCCLSWGFNAGNFVLIRHEDDPDAAITFYSHLRRGSIIVANGQQVKRGEKIAEVGSSGASLTPHLHFGVWSKVNGHFQLTDPWAGKCGPNFDKPLWQFSPPYRADVIVNKSGTGTGIVSAADGEVNCGSNCSAILSPGTVVTLRATPYSGSEFAGWQGECTGAGKTCTFVAEGSSKVSAIFRDAAPPTVRAIAVPPFTTSLTVPIATFNAYDNVRVAGYLVTETPTQPSSQISTWQSTRPVSYTCSSPGAKTLYAWVKDAAGNVSAGVKASLVCGAVNAAQTKQGDQQGPSPRPVSTNPPSDGT